MPKKNTRVKNSKSKPQESDNVFFLKLVFYFVIGTQWLRLVDPEMTTQVPIPFGLLLGLVFASHDHFNIDRKIEYAVLLVASFIGYWIHGGILFIVL
jgi:hypothetical protein